MARWRKCHGCGRVMAHEEFDDTATDHANQVCQECEALAPEDRPLAKARKRQRGSSADSVRAYRERTGNAYGKAYAKAKAAAVKELVAAHPEEFSALLEKARIDVGLGPTRA